MGDPAGRPRLSVAVHTLGCRLNQYESDGILQSFLESGRYVHATDLFGADLHIINSCTVTDQADKRCLQLVRKIKKKQSSSQIILTGCLAQTDREQLQSDSQVDLLVGNENKSSLLSLYESRKGIAGSQINRPDLEKADQTKNHQVQTGGSSDSESQTIQQNRLDPYQIPIKNYANRPVMDRPFQYGYVVPQGHTRAYLKIQDGCNRKCSYCKIPAARGKGVSRPLQDVLDHIRALEEQGCAEIILTGVNLGWYRQFAEDQKIGFNILLEKILEHMQSSRLRISSIEPCDVNADLGRISQHSRFCDYLHVPLQSGSRRILRAMRRTYSPDSFNWRIEQVRHFNPQMFIGTDLMIGFPGENTADFQDSLNLCRQIEFASIHPFRFSARKGTPAALAQNQIDTKTIKERMQEVLLLREELQNRYRRRFIGHLRPAILEKEVLDNKDVRLGQSKQYELLTDNFLRVRAAVQGPEQLKRGGVYNVRLTELRVDRYMLGLVVAD